MNRLRQRTDDPDLELVRRCQDGDLSAFGDLVRRHQQAIFAFCVRFLKNTEDAEDIAQETFVQAYKNIGRFRPKAKFSTWLFTIARNLSLNFIRDKRPSAYMAVSVDDDEHFVTLTAASSSRPDNIADSRETAAQVRRCIDKLSADHKMIIVLRDLEGLSYEEIGEVMKCRAGTVKSRLSRARACLKEIIAAEMSWDDGLI